MPFWSRKQSPSVTAAKYMNRSKRRMFQAALLTQGVEVWFVTEHDSDNDSFEHRELIGSYITQQEGEILPEMPGMNRHSENFIEFLRTQYMKMDDILYNQGNSLDDIFAEEEELLRVAADTFEGYRSGDLFRERAH